MGVEKIIINTQAVLTPQLIKEASSIFGSSTIVAAVDYRKDLFGNLKVYIESGQKKTKWTLVDYVKEMEAMGAGELFLNCVDREGQLLGYDLKTIKELSSIISIPIIASGGAGNANHFKEAFAHGASAVSAGSMFVYQGTHKAVLINYENLL